MIDIWTRIPARIESEPNTIRLNKVELTEVYHQAVSFWEVFNDEGDEDMKKYFSIGEREFEMNVACWYNGKPPNIRDSVILYERHDREACDQCGTDFHTDRSLEYKLFGPRL